MDKNSKIKKNNSEGEILIKDNNVMKEYWCDTSRSKNSFLNGWFKTGDLGLIDRNGYLFVTGRIKDMINIGGLKTSSNEINDAYNKMPGIKDFHAFSVADKEKLIATEKIVAAVTTYKKMISILIH